MLGACLESRADAHQQGGNSGENSPRRGPITPTPHNTPEQDPREIEDDDISEDEALDACKHEQHFGCEVKLEGPEALRALSRMYRSMDSQIDSVEVQKEGLIAIYRLAWGNPSNCAIISRRNGGMQRIYAAMDTHADSELIQHWACVALEFLASCCEESRAVAKKGGQAIPRLLRAINTFPGSAKVTIPAELALEVLEYSPEDAM